MGDDEVRLSMDLPLDSDGFLRRECPTCERQFKVYAANDDDDAAALVPDGGYFCPYCIIQAPVEDWTTEEQLALAINIAEREVLAPMLNDFTRSMSGSVAGLEFKVTGPATPAAIPPLVEEDDMRRVDFACHPGAPVKVLDDWPKAVSCLLCGEPSS